ncbi:MAG TPA: regulatory iron-sulfur-containing complex subunit RicT [Anaerolineales bacterium]|nr:regulatory iron-sulfur-containing complex subunit RicT [Anaerolineales bacterium]
MGDASGRTQRREPYVVGLRFQKAGKIYHFDASRWHDLQPGDYVVVETSRGRQLGQVVCALPEAKVDAGQALKSVLRKATPQDLVLRQTWQQKEAEAVDICRSKVADLGLVDVKIMDAEFSYDGARLSLLYSSEAGEKADLRSLRRSMQRVYQQSHVELHLVGPRDVAKYLGGMGACGLENRCCATFLTEFSPISIKMAKEQGISLTPTEITGMCGRLRCCLVYEYEQYVEARKQLPKRGKRVVTPAGNGKVVEVLAMKDAVMVELDENGVQREFGREELQPWDELDAMRKKADVPNEHPPEADRNANQKPEKKEERGKQKKGG